MNSKAYEEGFKSCLFSDYINPYPEESHEFDEYERGRSQKIKRSGSNSSFSSGFDDCWVGELEPVREVTIKPQKLPSSTPKPNAYAQAKGRSR